MAKPAKKAYSLKEIAREWSRKWKDEVTEEDVLSYAQQGSLTISTLIHRKHFHVLNLDDFGDHDDRDNHIAQDGTTWIFDTFVPLESRWATVLLQEGAVPMVDFRFNDMHLKPVGDVLHHGLRDHYVLLEDKIRFEQSIKGDVPTIKAAGSPAVPPTATNTHH